MGVSVARRPTKDWLVMATRMENSCEFKYVKQFHLFNDVTMYSIISPSHPKLTVDIAYITLGINYKFYSTVTCIFLYLQQMNSYVLIFCILEGQFYFERPCLWENVYELINLLMKFDHCSFGSCLIMFMLL